MSNHTISCLIKKGKALYYTGEGWDNNINRACLYTSSQTKPALKLLEPTDINVHCVCVLQNKRFYYLAPRDKWVRDLSEAALFSMDDAEGKLAALKKLNDKQV